MHLGIQILLNLQALVKPMETLRLFSLTLIMPFMSVFHEIMKFEYASKEVPVQRELYLLIWNRHTKSSLQSMVISMSTMEKKVGWTCGH
jgi:hypothetical protein